MKRSKRGAATEKQSSVKKRVKYDSNSSNKDKEVILNRSQSMPTHKASVEAPIYRMGSCPPVFFTGHKLLKKARQTLERQPSLARDAILSAWNPATSSMSLVDRFTNLEPTKGIIEEIKYAFATYEDELSHGDGYESICDILLDSLSKRLYELRNTGASEDTVADYFSGFNKSLADKSTMQQ